MQSQFDRFGAVLLVVAALSPSVVGQRLWDVPSLHPGQRLFDMDGDGDLDIVSETGALRAWIQEGDCQFVPGSSAHAFSAGFEVARFGDVFGDDGVDAIVTDYNRVRVFPWRTSETRFVAPIAFQLSAPEPVAVSADWDGDGQDEVLISHRSFGALETTLMWARVQYSGFDVLEEVVVPGEYLHAVPWDFDMDGDADVLLKEYKGTRLALFRNEGGVTSTTAIGSYGVGLSLKEVEPHDLDGDGDLDLVLFGVGLEGELQLALLIHDGNGALNLLGELSVIELPPNSKVDRIRVADWDLDGDMDVALDEGIAEQVAPGVFASELLRIRTSDVGDVDGDGFADSLGASASFSSVSPMTYGKGSFDAEDHWITRSTDLMATRTGDVDADGDLDLIESPRRIGINAGSGKITLRESSYPDGATYSGNAPPADFDGDGRVEFIERRDDDGSTWLARLGAGSTLETQFASAQSISISPREDWSHAVDLDLDGDLEFVTSGSEVLEPAAVWWNGGSGTFEASTALAQGSVWDVGDVDSDGDQDLLVAGAVGHIRLFRNDGGGGLAMENATPASQTRGTRFFDVDEDGLLEIVYIDQPHSAANLVAMDVGPQGAGPTELVALSGLLYKGFDFADVDGDGAEDLLLDDASDLLQVQWGSTDDSLSFSPACSYDLDVPIEHFSAVDLDQDGDLDLSGIKVSASQLVSGAEAGSFRQFGEASVGSGFWSPLLGVEGALGVGQEVTYRLSQARGASFGIFAYGSAQTEVFDYPAPGLTLYVGEIAELIPIVVDGEPGDGGSGDWSLSLSVPASFAGVTLYGQVLLADPATQSGLAFSNALETTYGP